MSFCNLIELSGRFCNTNSNATFDELPLWPTSQTHEPNRRIHSFVACWRVAHAFERTIGEGPPNGKISRTEKKHQASKPTST